MSIIREALEKVQNVADNRKPFTQAQKDIIFPKQDAPLKINLRLDILLGLLLITLALFAANQFAFKGSIESKKMIPVDADTKGISAHQEIVYRQTAKQAMEPMLTPPELVLSGIMYLQEGARAIINNSIVGVGDIISGAKVSKINKKSVVLDSNSAEITLTLK